MKFSTSLPGINLYPPITCDWEHSMGAADFQLVARTADELGYDSLAIPEHIVIPADMVDLMGSFWSHAMTAMAFVAGATTRLTVDSSVIVTPYHDPVVLAKAVSTLDLLSGGRVRLSLGVGHAEREFEVLRAPFHERGRMTDEYIAVMIELWTSDTPEFHGTVRRLRRHRLRTPARAAAAPAHLDRRQLARRHAPRGTPRRLVPVADHRRPTARLPRVRALVARVRGAEAAVRRGDAADHARRRRASPTARRRPRACARTPGEAGDDWMPSARSRRSG